MNKHERYRQRLKREGKCPHCGQPCAPYAECAERRKYKRLNYDRTSADKVNFRRDVTSKKRAAPRGLMRYWTAEEDALLRAMTLARVPLATMAKRLNRTEGALIARHRKMEASMT